MTALEIIADAMDEENMMYGADKDNAAIILAALTDAGYVICPFDWERRAAFGMIGSSIIGFIIAAVLFH